MRPVNRKALFLAGLVALGVVCIGATIVIVRGNRSSNGGSFSRTWYLHTGELPLRKPCFRQPRTYQTGARGSDTVVVLDLDGDGHPDLASPDLGRNFVSVARNSGGGDFERAGVFRTGKRPYVLAAGDLNGDLSPDLVAANVTSGTVSVLLNVGDGSFGPRTDYRVGQVPDSVVIGDIDGDGSADIVVTNQVGPSYTSVLLNAGDGTFSRRTSLSVRRADALADLNGDGKLDLVSLGERTASVLLGLGGGRFAAAVPYPTGDGPTWAAVGDLNGDRAVDLVTANYGREPMGVGDTVSVLINKGDGTFRHKRDFVVGEYPTSVAIGDVTGDEKPDLVSVDAETGDVSILKNDGHAGFRDRLTYPYEDGGGAESASIADTNGDGEADLVVNLGGNAAVLLNVPGPCRDAGFIEQAR
jgi:hypothetical protein